MFSFIVWKLKQGFPTRINIMCQTNFTFQSLWSVNVQSEHEGENILHPRHVSDRIHHGRSSQTSLRHCYQHIYTQTNRTCSTGHPQLVFSPSASLASVMWRTGATSQMFHFEFPEIVSTNSRRWKFKWAKFWGEELKRKQWSSPSFLFGFFFLLKCIFPSSLTSQKNITTSLAGYWRFHSPGAFRMLITPEKRGAFEAVSLTQWWLWFNSPWDEMRTLFWPGRTFYNHR